MGLENEYQQTKKQRFKYLMKFPIENAACISEDQICSGAAFLDWFSIFIKLLLFGKILRGCRAVKARKLCSRRLPYYFGDTGTRRN